MEHETTCAIYDNDIFERHCTCGADLVPPRVVGFEVIINGVSVLDKVGVNSRDFESYELVRRSEAEAWTAARIASLAAGGLPIQLLAEQIESTLRANGDIIVDCRHYLELERKAKELDQLKRGRK